ncbi:MAG: hypothetical protein DUD32_08935 [Lactobacillus sp.]|nr:MAG: hypothetical protein DUD32_08935 [Lactobacillus sp.]
MTEFIFKKASKKGEDQGFASESEQPMNFSVKIPIEMFRSLDNTFDPIVTPNGDVFVRKTTQQFAIILSTMYSFHSTSDGALYITLNNGKLHSIDSDQLDRLITACLHRYALAKPNKSWDSTVVYSELKKIASVSYSTCPNPNAFRPNEWDHKDRLPFVLSHFFKVEKPIVSTLGYLTMLFQWYQATRYPKRPDNFSVVPILQSDKEGVGKSAMSILLGKLDDRLDYLPISSWDDLTNGDKVRSIESTSLILWDELKSSDLKRRDSLARNIATTATWHVNKKYLPAYDVARTQPLIMTTNEQDVLPNGSSRRFVMIHVDKLKTSPFAKDDLEEAMSFLQQVLNQVAYVYDHTDQAGRVQLCHWEESYTAEVMSESTSDEIDGLKAAVESLGTGYHSKKEILSAFPNRTVAPMLSEIGERISTNSLTNAQLLEACAPKFYKLLAALFKRFNAMYGKDPNKPVIDPVRKHTSKSNVHRIDLKNMKPGSLSSDFMHGLDKKQLLASWQQKKYEILVEGSKDHPKKKSKFFDDSFRKWCLSRIESSDSTHSGLQKKPMYFNGQIIRPLTGSFDSDERNRSLASYKEVCVEKDYMNKRNDGYKYEIGLNLDKDVPLIVMDVDDGDISSDLIGLKELRGLVSEKSISGTGRHYFSVDRNDVHEFHRICDKRKSFQGTFLKKNIEIYRSGKVITMTDPSILNDVSDESLYLFDVVTQSIQEQWVMKKYAEELAAEVENTSDEAESTSDKVIPIKTGYDKMLESYADKKGLTFEEGNRHNAMASVVGWASSRGDIPEDIVYKWLAGKFPDWSEFDYQFADMSTRYELGEKLG